MSFGRIKRRLMVSNVSMQTFLKASFVLNNSLFFKCMLFSFRNVVQPEAGMSYFMQ